METSLAAHLSASLFLFPIGLRRLFSSSSLYLNNQSLFRSQTWYLSQPKWKNLDLYILTVALPIASFSEVFIFLSFSGHPTYKFSFLHQSLLLFLYWLLVLLFLLKDSVDPLFINENFLFLSSGLVFLMEYYFIGEGVSGIVGEVVYELCSELTLVCAFCCVYLGIRRGAFFAEFCLCCGLVFKGFWMFQAGLCLYTDTFAFKGCHKVVVSTDSINAEYKCDLEVDGLRAVSLVNLWFVGYAIVVFLISFGVFGLLSSNKNLRHDEASGSLKAGLESDAALRRTFPEIELE